MQLMLTGSLSRERIKLIRRQNVPVLLDEFKTVHSIFSDDARNMQAIHASSVDLVVTSPPYPMIGMWDELFTQLNPQIGRYIMDNSPDLAYDLMHQELGMVWNEVYRVLKPGGIACINIGDATRTVGGEYRLYPSHSTVSASMRDIGFYESPSIIWRKQSNSPNKFLGSGTMPPGAYVTLEHEYILLFRKPPRRQFSGTGEKKIRSESSYFWEERNQWFSDLWENVKGVRQGLSDAETRKRSAAFPFEVPYRLINMFSVAGDTVLDPFLGTGTTTLAAIASMRNSIGYEKEPELCNRVIENALKGTESLNEYLEKRIQRHLDYVKNTEIKGSAFSYFNEHHGFPVKTRNERDLCIRKVKSIHPGSSGNAITAFHSL